LSVAADKYRFTRPAITEDNVINVVGGRHPLQELVVPTFIENDTFLVGGTNPNYQHEMPNMILITGANYSGKSVYMKQVSHILHLTQVALIVYMSHLGRFQPFITILNVSFVPAQSAVIGITDKILTRIATKESVSKVGPHYVKSNSQIASAFMIDVQQIALAIRACTRRSLIVIDEFGKGTEAHGTLHKG
jgi:DNA mismatch repair protein MSH5